MSSIAVGKKVPDFEMPSTEGEPFKLSKHKGEVLVLYFYPKDATPGCTLEGHEFTKLKSQFSKLNARVYGVSRDTLKSHEKFKEKQCYSIDLLSDEDETVCNLFGVLKEKNMYGKKVIGIERSTFLIGEDGKLLKEWRKVKAEGHAKEVLDEAKRIIG
ncbi:MAG: peroxiredoxin [Bdellovibrionales bacterium CG10_big_fil_rev_8_21_14_0_10_45_34]|nr:MAG: peroxiredoxin [Bdellovibrionales bacterium CG10_big_fil_rev_8_21_14_0_10_45_34]